MNYTTIRVSKELRNELSMYGSKQESFDSIIFKIIKEKKSQTLAEEPEISTPEKEVLFNAH